MKPATPASRSTTRNQRSSTISRSARVIARAAWPALVALLLACSEPPEPPEPPSADEASEPQSRPAPASHQPDPDGVESDPNATAEARRSETPPNESSIVNTQLASLVALNVPEARLELVLDGLERPWAFEFLSERELIITEIGGRMLRYHIDTGARIELQGVPPVATSRQQTGLLDVEVHPDFERNGRIYFSYAETNPDAADYFATVVDTAIVDGDRLVDVERLLTAEPYGWSPSNFGGLMEFDGDGFLYVTIGDRSEKTLAQNPTRLQGKILRLRDDGTVPDDNPFVDDPDVDDRIYALGVRNAQGLHYDPVSGNLYEAEHGPMGGDEVNRIEPGANYGWPVISHGKNYTPQAMGYTDPAGDDPLLRLHLAINPMLTVGEGTHREGMEQPLFYYLPSIAASPLTMVRGAMFPEWDGDLLVGALKGQHVSKLDLDDGVVRSEFAMLGEIGGRIRDLRVAGDGSIYILAQQGMLYRLYRPEMPDDRSSVPERPGEAIYTMVCAGCHDTGSAGAQRLDQPSSWDEVLSKPREAVYDNVIHGINAMPARGLCDICTDEQLRQTTDYMIESVVPND